MKRIWQWILSLFKGKSKEKKIIFVNERYYVWEPQEKDLLDKINVYRKENGLEVLIPDDRHYDLAEHRVKYLLQQDNITHSGFPVVFRKLIDSGLSWAGENIAYAYSRNKGVMDAWKRSEAHNKNILREDWVYTGIRIIEFKGRKYYCQLFSK